MPLIFGNVPCSVDLVKENDEKLCSVFGSSVVGVLITRGLSAPGVLGVPGVSKVLRK